MTSDWEHQTAIPAFIIHSNLKAVASALKETVALQRVRMLVGDRNTGKTRLLWELVHQSDDFPTPAQTLYVMLPEVAQGRKKRYEHASAVTCDAFAQLEAKARARQPVAKLYRRRSAPEHYPVVKDGTFISAFRRVVQMLNTGGKQIKAIIVDRGEYADVSTLRYLCSLHEQTYHRLGIILSIQTATPDTPDEVLAEQRTAVPALADVALSPIVLDTITSLAVFRREVLPQMLGKRNLAAELDDALKPHYPLLSRAFFSYTGGNWRRIDHLLALHLDKALDAHGPPNAEGVRRLTIAGANQVLKALAAPTLEELVAQTQTPAVPDPPADQHPAPAQTGQEAGSS